MTLQVRLLGNCTLTDPQGNAIDLPTRKAWGLLAYLCQSSAADISREALAILLWPRGSEVQARASLRQELAVLRKALARAHIDGIAASKDRVGLSLPDGIVDTDVMVKLLAKDDIDALRAGVELYSGAFLDDLKLRAPRFEEWQRAEAQKLKTKITLALQRLLAHDAAETDFERTLLTARNLLAVEPTQEPAYLAMMRVFQHLGRRSEALQTFQHCCDVLHQELQASPSQEIVGLADEIRNESGATVPIPQISEVVLLCARLAGTEERRAAGLLQAQQRLRQRVNQVVSASGGLVLPGLGDRVIAVFSQTATEPTTECVAAQAALAICATPLANSDQEGLSPRASIAGGKMLIAPSTVVDQGAFAAGHALSLVETLVGLASGGQVIASDLVIGRLPTNFNTTPVVVSQSRVPGQQITIAKHDR